MLLKKDVEIRDVLGLTDEEKIDIINFLQGAVYCWCKNRPDEWFSIRDLMGGENFYWDGTPMQVLFEKHEKKNKSPEESIKGAGIDSGWLLLAVIDEDIRLFDTKKDEQIRKYLWINVEE